MIKCLCLCHKRGMISCSICCRNYEHINKTQIKPYQTLERCERCDGSGILIREIPTYINVVKTQIACPDCQGNGIMIKENEY